MTLQKFCRTTPQEISSLVKNLGHRIVQGGVQDSEEINILENSFRLSLPEEYRSFLKNYGAIWCPEFAVFGLGNQDEIGLTVSDVVLMLRLASQEFPHTLVPIEDLGDGCFACLSTRAERAEENLVCPVVGYDLENPLPLEESPKLSDCFSDYLFTRLSSLLDDAQAISKIEDELAWKLFEKHVLEFNKKHNYSHKAGGKLPRNHDWRPYRYCIQDVLFGITVVKHNREFNCLEVDVFLTAEIPEYGLLAGAIALTSFLLSEAYKCGGTMEIRFTNDGKRGKIPQELQALASGYGIEFSQTEKGYICSDEAKALYAALTNFSLDLQDAINQLEAEGRAKMARACYVVNHGVWTKEQVEMIMLGSERPDSILSGKTQPHQWILYQHDLLHARAVLLGGMFDRLLVQRIRLTQDGIDYDMEDDVRQIAISFDGELYAKRYFSEDSVPLPIGWLDETEREHEIPPRTPFHVLVRARDSADLQWNLSEDIQQAANHHQQIGEPTFLLLPHDFNDLPKETRIKFTNDASRSQVGILICPDTVLTFDTDAAKDLARSRILRQ